MDSSMIGKIRPNGSQVVTPAQHKKGNGTATVKAGDDLRANKSKVTSGGGMKK